MSRYEIRLSGSGGQGLILAGIILAEAAIMDGLNAVQTQSYGPEARGGASRAEVIIDTDEIDYPKVTRPDCLLAMTQEAMNKYGGKLSDGGMIVVDSDLVADCSQAASGSRLLQLPLVGTAVKATERRIVANIVALGVLSKLTGMVRAEKVEEAILNRVPPGTEELNRKAFWAGHRLV